jgi:aspartate racemase
MDRTRRTLLSEQLPQEKAYWLEKLGGDLTLSGIPLDYKRTAGLSDKKTVAIDLDAQSVGKLFKATNQNEFLIFTILVTVLKICLSKYNGVEDVSVGTTVYEQHKEDALLNKVLVLRDRVNGEVTFKQLLRDIKNTIYEAFSHQKFPFESILELLHVSAPENRTPLFNVAVLLDNLQSRENISDLKNDVTVIFSIKDGHLTGVIEYNSNLFKERTLRSFARHYDNVLRATVAKPDQKISAIELLSQAEKQELIFGFNNTERDYPRQKLIHELFEEQVERSPEATALVWEAESLSYRELNERANQVAGYLRELGVGREVLVAVMLERSVELVVGLLGVLKAGGAYVPLDVQYPGERIGYMLKDTGAPVLLTQQRLVGQLPEHEARVVCLDSEWGEISRQKKTNPESLGTADNLAYVIYTSGSTGNPKGVSVPQRAVVRLVKETNYAEFNGDETFLQLAPLAFDASTFEIWGCLLNGARLVMMPPRQLSLTELGEALKRCNVTTLWLTAGLFHLMVDERLADLTSLHQLLAGGDVLSAPHVQKFLREAKDCTLINGYGPTENTTFTCCYRMRNGDHFESSVPIGVPIAHTQAYVLDERLQPVPIGVTGELYIGGDGLARGYFHDPQLTAERFIPHPFSSEGGLRLYRSGDLVRRLPNGVLEFVGRRDQQVKIRGFRIEPGEIEAVLGQYEAVRECAVVVRPDSNGEKRLVAYIVPNAGQLSNAELQSYLKKKLPEYMLPAVFVMLDSLPLTVNGKVDRQALPEPENVRPELDEGYVEPRTEMEALLVSIWQNLLRKEHVGVYDSFFDLGGHSLLATRLVMQVQQVFGVELRLWRIFEKPTVADMAEALTEAIRKGDKLPPMEAIQRPERIPLSHA